MEVEAVDGRLKEVEAKKKLTTGFKTGLKGHMEV